MAGAGSPTLLHWLFIPRAKRPNVTQSPDPSSYTWGLALIALALLVALLGALTDRVRPAAGLSPEATVVADPMGFTMPELQQPADCMPAAPALYASVSAIPTD